MVEMPASGGEEILRATCLGRTFAGVQALRNGSFNLRKGEVHALVGENGAGKSTLIRIISGAIAPDNGELVIGGQPVKDYTPHHARALGVSVIYQQPALFAELSVAENLALGLEPSILWRRVDHNERRMRAVELLARVGSDIDPGLLVRELSLPQQQLVEIARALGRSSRILVLDEPTAALSEREVQNLFAILATLRRQGIGIIYISHRMEEIFTLADRITVLRDGETISTLNREDADSQTLIRLMVGRELARIFPARPETTTTQETVLKVDGLTSVEAGVCGVSFELRAGEILGVAGLVGAGRSELARTLFGLHPHDCGQVSVRSTGGHLRRVRISDPATAVAVGIGYVPEDRRRHGVIPELSVTYNTSLAVLPRLARAALVDNTAVSTVALSFAQRLRLKARELYRPVATLSGGNQQKVALARWLAINPCVLILDEPTQGIDVGAKAEIHLLMRELVKQGMSIIMISSDLPEILGMSDRIMVMRDGASIATIARAEATSESIISIALGPGSQDYETV